MIDSVNFIIKNIENVDFKHLAKMGVRAKRFENKISDNYTIIGYQFKYCDIEFKYYKSYKVILVIANAHNVLGKADITVADCAEYKNKLNKAITKVVCDANVQYELNRIDYCVDLTLPHKQMLRYITLLNLHPKKYKYMAMKQMYSTSVYITNKNGQTTCNIYIREYCTKNENDKNILRIEVQNKKSKVKKNFKEYGVIKEIDNYWTEESFNENLIEFSRGYLFEGNYYNRQKAKQILMNSGYKEIVKKKLYRFLLRIERFGIDEIVSGKRFYCRQTAKKYIQLLNEIKINPILLPRIWTDISSMDNLLELAQKTANEKYFFK